MTSKEVGPVEQKFSRPVRILGSLIFIALFLVAAELVAFASYFIRDGRYLPVRSRLDTGMGNAIAAAGRQESDPKNCRWIDSLVPHPYLGYALHGDDDCPVEWPNRHGLVGRDFPTEQQSDTFDVLLGGGSVAMFLGQFFPKMPLYLEDAMNRCYLPPEGQGRSFKVYNGAVGGYRYPHQSIVFLLFGRPFDAFVTLEGWNEYHAALRTSEWYGGPTGRFETPEIYYSQIASKRTDGRVVAAVYAANWIQGVAKSSWLLRHSFASYFFIEQIVSWLQREAHEAIQEGREADDTTAESMLALPDDWDRERVVRFNLEQYKWHLVNLHAMAQKQRIPSLTFFQPVPSLFKKLTPEEAALAQENPLDHEPVSYLAMIEDLMSMRQSHGLPLASLLEVFKDRSETIYADAVHFEIEGLFPESKFDNAGREPTGRSLGYELVATAMADTMAEAFKFQRKQDCTAPK